MTTTLERDDTATDPSAGNRGRFAPRPPRRGWRRTLVGALVGLAVVLSAAAIPLSMGYLPSVYQPPLPDDAAFAVGRNVVTVADYDKRVRTLRALYGAQVPGDPAGQDRFRRDAAKSMASQKVMEQAMAERNIVIPDTRLRQQLTGMVEAQFGKGPDGYRQFMEGLRQAGSSEPEMLEEIRQQIAMTELVTQVTNEVQEPRDEELPPEFPKYAEALGVPEQRRLANIVVPSREQAQDIVDQARTGIPFADLARRLSIDGATRDNGGDLGEAVTRDKLQPGYSEAAFAVPQGQVFGPVQSAQGWNVGQVLAVTPGQPASYQESVIPLKTAVWNERKFEHWKQWFQQRLDDADLRYADAYRPTDGNAPPAALDAVSPTPQQGGAPVAPAPQGAAPTQQGPAPQPPAVPAPAPR